ncbi:MAG: EAL domain-containing protein [Paludibacterium sp.]|uniref:bifunctional diguanylate cyclase/phosphodiesterase n=1 Tax=Paludibacterium sp. TaxID=1917523 RepID=UPI0025F0B7E5|nr:LapD/MoxY N-terminal periplasmic domain-containing protein [Paludibacterium sp.]MBV8046509.1 EAL domain-containing protein [Paludibacterium sp.]MBV8648899.1 EAL domain-containing protein [Paludibacterium sp.]
MSTTKFSLIQRLWILLLLVATLSIGGALVANLLNARQYLEQQLSAQSADTAHSLALTLTQYHADPVMAQALLNATFDLGHFAEVRWEAVDGHDAIRLRTPAPAVRVPGWFIRLLPISPTPGSAQVLRGWLQAGHIVVVAQPTYAYLSLWQGATQTVLWLAVVGLLAAGLGAVDIRRVRRQLAAVVAQASAISEQRFYKIPMPGIPELAQVADAMNQMVDRLQSYLEGLRDELDRLRQSVLTDRSTGLPNREAFEQAFKALLAGSEDPVNGSLLLLRVAGLAELNQRLGGRRVDALLKRVADDLQACCQTHQGWLATRLRGADFAILCPELAYGAACGLADELCAAWNIYPDMGLTDQPGVGHIGLVDFQSGDDPAQTLQRASQALTLAEAGALDSWRADTRSNAPDAVANDHDWQQLLDLICCDGSLQLRWYPVCHPDGGLKWQEGMLYRPARGALPQLSALRIVSHALRLGRVYQIDLHTLELALSLGPHGRLAINVSPASLAHDDFLPGVLALLRAHPARQIHFEFHETGLEEHWDAFVHFCLAVRPAGHRVAVEILGHDMGLVAKTHEAGIAYLVLDNALTQGIHADEGRAALVRGLLQMASLMAMEIEAKGVDSNADLEALVAIGVHCLTGPAVR